MARPNCRVTGVVLDTTEQLTQALYVKVVVENFCCEAGMVDAPPAPVKSEPLIAKLNRIFPRFDTVVEALVEPVSADTAREP